MKTKNILKVFLSGTVLVLLFVSCPHIHREYYIRPDVHPRLFFYDTDLRTVRKNAFGAMSDIWAVIKRGADECIASGIPEFPALVEKTYQNTGNNIYTVAFAYLVTLDRKYFEWARDSLRAVCSWPFWGARLDNQLDRDFALQYMIRGVAYAYDWLYNDLSQSDRLAVAEALGKYTQQMYEAATSAYNADWNNFWIATYNQNHWSTNNAALGLAGLALWGTDDRADGWIMHATQQMTIKSQILAGIGDGTWHEGVQYQNADLLYVIPFWYNLRRIKNIDLIPHSYFQNFVFWKAYNYLPGSCQSVLPFGDYMPEWNGGNGWAGIATLSFVAGEYRSSLAQWLHAEAVKTLPSWGRDPTDAAYWIMELLYGKTGIIPMSPSSLPLSRVFPDQDSVIWRTGWEDDDLVFGLRAAAYTGRYIRDTFMSMSPPVYCGHDHPDAPGFYLYRGNADLSSEMAEYSASAGPTPFAHNTIAVNSTDQFLDPWGRLYPDSDPFLEIVCQTSNNNFLIADSTDRYREVTGAGNPPGSPLVSEFRRYVLFDRPDHLVIIDNLKASSTNRYDWIAFFSESAPASISVDGSWIKGPSTGGNVLGIYVASPSDFFYETGSLARPYTTQTKPYIRVRPQTNVADTRFIMLLYPTTDGGWSSKPVVQLLGDSSAGGGIAVTDAAGKSYNLFCYYRNPAEISIGEFSFKALAAKIKRDSSDVIQLFFLANSTHLSENYGSRNLFESGSPCTVEVRYEGSTLYVEGAGLSGCEIWAPVATAVYLNGVAASFSRNADIITLQ
ncbi:MAG: DUF4962 domain-containing protein [Spirochaetaceae bacterium]|nr:MAG: DUF4962 domain-containing protein [Spirochaetaceae bacterium]